MKKILKLLLLTILFIPYIIKADMGAPMTRTYKMIVTNPNGIDYYEYNYSTKEFTVKGHLNKNDTFSVLYEYDVYTIQITGQGSTYDLKDLNGTALLKEEVDPEIDKDDPIHDVSIEPITKNNEALIYADEGVDVRKGPASVYKKVGHLDKNTKVKYTYYYSDGSGIINIYIEYNGIKGWIEILEGKVLLENTTKYIAKTDYDLGCATIPKNTIITPKYTSDAWSRKVLVDYNNCTKLYDKLHDNGLVLLSYNNQEQGTSKKEIDIYEFFNDSGKKIATIPTDTTFTIIGNANQLGEEEANLYIQYENNTGWIHINHNDYEWKYVEDATPIAEPTTNKPTENNNSTAIGPETETPIDYITTYIILCSVIVIMAIVIIILINKKKNTKKETN